MNGRMLNFHTVGTLSCEGWYENPLGLGPRKKNSRGVKSALGIFSKSFKVICSYL